MSSTPNNAAPVGTVVPTAAPTAAPATADAPVGAVVPTAAPATADAPVGTTVPTAAPAAVDAPATADEPAAVDAPAAADAPASTSAAPFDPLGDDSMVTDRALDAYYPTTFRSNIRLAAGGGGSASGHLRVDGAAEIAGAMQARGEVALGGANYPVTIVGDLTVQGNIICNGDLDQGPKSCPWVYLDPHAPQTLLECATAGAYIILAGAVAGETGASAIFLACSSGVGGGIVSRMASSPGADGEHLDLVWPAGELPRLCLLGGSGGHYNVAVHANNGLRQ